MIRQDSAIGLVRASEAGTPGGLLARPKGHRWLLCVALGIAAMGTTATADDFPAGCVSCHVVLEDGADKRLAAVLDEIGHLALKDKVATVPTDCIGCHEKKSDTKFSVLIHQAHFGSPETNLFVQRFGGDCRNCHAMDGSSGQPSLKEGDRNW